MSAASGPCGSAGITARVVLPVQPNYWITASLQRVVAAQPRHSLRCTTDGMQRALLLFLFFSRRCSPHQLRDSWRLGGVKEGGGGEEELIGLLRLLCFLG
jgi:hypothetical protein